MKFQYSKIEFRKTPHNNKVKTQSWSCYFENKPIGWIGYNYGYNTFVFIPEQEYEEVILDISQLSDIIRFIQLKNKELK